MEKKNKKSVYYFELKENQHNNKIKPNINEINNEIKNKDYKSIPDIKIDKDYNKNINEKNEIINHNEKKNRYRNRSDKRTNK